ncbi:hypothetical protein GDO81_027127 [Engystomops pustulosus]|uniref:Uncharacterized protein n=1 Tax=Engystomops pustulosus TaxID=76066 RepID=A0AAV6YHC4_ENGPU|nr:hypothetical protein GDO81_027127 [Engystomops pustulosus]
MSVIKKVDLPPGTLLWLRWFFRVCGDTVTSLSGSVSPLIRDNPTDTTHSTGGVYCTGCPKSHPVSAIHHVRCVWRGVITSCNCESSFWRGRILDTSPCIPAPTLGSVPCSRKPEQAHSSPHYTSCCFWG